jgi:hypothetical protein
MIGKMKKTNFQSLETAMRLARRLACACGLISAAVAMDRAGAEEIKIAPKSYAVVVASAPREIPLRDLKLREAGMTGGGIFLESDEIRVFKNKDVMNESPLARIWINAARTNSYWFNTGGKGSAENFVVQPGNAVVVFARASTSGIVIKTGDGK